MNTKDRSRDDATTPSFDWSLMRSFLAVLDAGSLLGAAKLVGASQPTVGRRIEALEAQLGRTLFERTGRGLVPTEHARLIAGYARRMQGDADDLSRAVAGGGDHDGAGLVRIASSRLAATWLLPDIVAALQVEAPRLDIAIVASDKVSNLLRRDADIAIRNVRPDQASLIARKIGESAVVACASPRYLERNGRPESLADVLRHRLVAPDDDPYFRARLEAAAASTGTDPRTVRLALRCDDFSTRLAAVRAGLGIGFLSSHVVRRAPDVAILPIALGVPPLPSWLVVHREIRTVPRIRLVYDWLLAALKERL